MRRRFEDAPLHRALQPDGGSTWILHLLLMDHPHILDQARTAAAWLPPLHQGRLCTDGEAPAWVAKGKLQTRDTRTVQRRICHC